MAGLAETISYINENALAACFPNPSNELKEQDRAALTQYVKWCNDQRVPCCPVRPTTVAAFLRWLADFKIPENKILEIVFAIQELHHAGNFANPVATPIVRAALEAIVDIKPPRSWTKDEKISFAMLPADIRGVIERRETDRETAIRRSQNELAELKKAKRHTQAEPIKESVEPKEEITANG